MEAHEIILDFSNNRKTVCMLKATSEGFNETQIKSISEYFTKMMNKFTDININMLADTSSFNDILLKHNIGYCDEYVAEYNNNKLSIILNNRILRTFTTDRYKLLLEINKATNKKNKNDIEKIIEIHKIKNLESIVMHEFGHAIIHQYTILLDNEVLDFYYKNNIDMYYSDADEFLTDCFVASELVKNNRMANTIRSHINRIIQARRN